MIIGLIAIFSVIVFIDLPGLLKKTNQRAKTMIVYFFLLAAGLTISIMQLLEKAPVSPAKIIEKMVKLIILR
ncbi:hypothetical protein [Desulfitibacter alkalitolerans]|uniref:hypothetical protein n=1 Tax=Desulfitibacter alkalitolerans TaxID=264641 RepID=UPI0004842B9A|nr:hypothetical protein [Desulfitibacter alkalitolerans]